MRLEEYVDDAGRGRFGAWFATLNAPAAARVVVALARMELGNFSRAKPVGEGVSEYKIDFGPGYRIYFGKDGEALVILLVGGTKTRQSHDIATAKNFVGRVQGSKEDNLMPLMRSFKETVRARVQVDPAFRAALLTEAVSAFMQADPATGKSLLRDYINATVGFEELAAQTGKPSKSLMRMFGPAGNPSAATLFSVVGMLQRASGVTLEVRVA